MRRKKNKIVEERRKQFCNSQTKLKLRVFSGTLCICACVLFIYLTFRAK